MKLRGKSCRFNQMSAKNSVNRLSQ